MISNVLAKGFDLAPVSLGRVPPLEHVRAPELGWSAGVAGKESDMKVRHMVPQDSRVDALCVSLPFHGG